MVNLLFISSNSKIAFIKSALQPLLKLKIDSVGDFDYGLKDVFEKRPAIVFIQDQIAGVTGESVARHIQMLLGSGAPTFILMHDGNLKAKLSKGLYEYLIDLSQTDMKVLADIQSTLELLLGPQWQKIYVPPTANNSVIKAAWGVPEEQHDSADQMVDDLDSDLGKATSSFNNNGQLPDSGIPESSTEEPLLVASSPRDQLDEIFAAASSELKDGKPGAASDNVKKVSERPESASTVDKSASTATLHDVSTPRADGGTAISDTSSTARFVSPNNGSSAKAPIRNDVSESSSSVSISPSKFTIGRESASAEIPAEDIFKDMEGYRSKPVVWRRITIIIVLLLVCAAVGYWYLLKYKSHLSGLPVKPAPPVVVSPPADKVIVPSSVVQQQVSAVRKNAKTALPSFIPLAGLDSKFATQKPDWERYVGTDAEFRLYRPAGKLKAVQVLAINDHVISESRLQSILTELTGTDAYTITSHKQKRGFTVSHATVGRKADLLIYRKVTALYAFVVSLN